MLFDIIKFIFFSLFLYLLPGYFFTIPLKFNLTSKERFISAWVTGIMLFTVLSLIFFRFYLIKYLFIITIIIDIISFYFLLHEKKLKKIKEDKKLLWTIPLVFVIVLGSLFFVSPLINNGRYLQSGLTMNSSIDHDSLWHLAIQNEILKQGIPGHPGFSGTSLKNYHYLSDVFLASFHYLSGISLMDLFFRYVPFMLSAFYGFSVFIIITNYVKNPVIGIFSVVFAYFSSCMSYLAPIFNPDNLKWGRDTFMLDQPFMLALNLHALFAVVVCFSAFIILNSSSKYFKLVLFGILIGISAGLKIYPALAVTAGLGLIAVIKLFTKKETFLFITLIVTLVIIGILTLITFKPGSSFLIFVPGWILKRMVEDPDRLYWPYFYLSEATYKLHNNIIRIWQLTIKEAIIYYLGNLSIGIFGFYYGLKKLLEKDGYIIPIFFITGFVSLTFPLFFNQKNSVYDIIQFGSLGVVIFLILSPLAVLSFKIKFRIPILIVLLTISLPVTFNAAFSALRDDQKIIPYNEIELYNNLKNFNRGVVLIYPLKVARVNLLIPALTGVDVFYADNKAAFITGKPVEKREQEIESFFNDPTYTKERQLAFLRKNQIKEIFLKKEDENWINKIKVNYRKTFENQFGSIYTF